MSDKTRWGRFKCDNFNNVQGVSAKSLAFEPLVECLADALKTTLHDRDQLDYYDEKFQNSVESIRKYKSLCIFEAGINVTAIFE